MAVEQSTFDRYALFLLTSTLLDLSEAVATRKAGRDFQAQQAEAVQRAIDTLEVAVSFCDGVSRKSQNGLHGGEVFAILATAGRAMSLFEFRSLLAQYIDGLECLLLGSGPTGSVENWVAHWLKTVRHLARTIPSRNGAQAWRL